MRECRCRVPPSSSRGEFTFKIFACSSRTRNRRNRRGAFEPRGADRTRLCSDVERRTETETRTVSTRHPPPRIYTLYTPGYRNVGRFTSYTDHATPDPTRPCPTARPRVHTLSSATARSCTTRRCIARPRARAVSAHDPLRSLQYPYSNTTTVSTDTLARRAVSRALPRARRVDVGQQRTPQPSQTAIHTRR